MRCLEDLRNWHTDETGYKMIEEEDDEMGHSSKNGQQEFKHLKKGKNTV